MEILDIFEGDAFRAASITGAINKRPFPPQFLGSLGIFTRTPIRTEVGSVLIDDAGNLKLIQTTPRGAPPVEQTVPPQSLRGFKTPRVAAGDTISASELAGILSRTALVPDAGPAIVLNDLVSEITYRMDGPNGLQVKMETTKEHMRLGAIAGIVLDADNSVIFDWSSILGMSLPAEIPFNLSQANPPAGTLTTLIRQTKRQILQAAKAGNTPGIRVIGLAGHDYFDALVKHSDAMAAWNTYQSTAAAQAFVRLGGPPVGIDPFSMFPFEGIEFYDYRGTDDNSTISIAADKVKLIPLVPGLFQEVLSPGENFDFVNTPGLPVYALVLPDQQRNAYVRLEVYSYPAYVATRPDVLFSGRAGT